MKATLALRSALVVVMLAPAFVLVLSAQAHDCTATAYPPRYNANHDRVLAEGKIDCTGNQPADVMTVKLWRVISFYPDDSWGQSQDGYPPNWPGFTYHEIHSACENDPPDDFKTETLGNDNLHNEFASASNGANLFC